MVDKQLVVGGLTVIDHSAVPRDRNVVAARQTCEGGYVRDRSHKQVEIYEDSIEFHPRSLAKKHKPIVVPKAVFTDPSEDDGRKVAILALARRISNKLEL